MTTCRVLCVKNVLYTFTSCQLGSAAMREGLKKMDALSEATSCLVRPSSSSVTLPDSSLLLGFKGIFKRYFFGRLRVKFQRNWVTGLCFRREAQPETKKKLLQLHPSLSHRHVKVTSNGKQYRSKPRPHTSLHPLHLNETTDCNYRSLCALYMRLSLLSRDKIHGRTHTHTLTLWRQHEA